jgi:hypothetical protein
MWLVYLRFDSPTETRIAMVRCSDRTEADEVPGAGKRFVGWVLTEYAVFYAHATIHARVVPNFPEELIYEAGDFYGPATRRRTLAPSRVRPRR